MHPGRRSAVSGAVKTGAVLVGFGGPRDLEEVGPMFARIFGGAPVPGPVLRVGLEKYQLLGGSSPLPRIADEIAGKLRAASERGELALDVVEPGFQFSLPLIADAVDTLTGAGCKRLLYLSLTPFHSNSAYFAPLEQLRTLARARDCTVIAAEPIGLSSEYVAATATRLQAALAGADEPLVVYTAHSLPLDGSEDTGRYDSELQAAAEQVMQALPAQERTFWFCAYTSQGARGAKWLEPGVGEALEYARTLGSKTIVVCPLGFATDHMEVLYDLDIKLKAAVEEAGLAYRRADTLGAADDALAAYIQVASRSLKAEAKPQHDNPPLACPQHDNSAPSSFCAKSQNPDS
ncbi:MAG: ferrochelatase [Coriobacteriia bacterium]|nr:ferrochelatase [Coriobacteriia bacterium]